MSRNKALIVPALLLGLVFKAALGESIPFDSDRWVISSEMHEIVEYKNRKALFLKNGMAYIDDLLITDGVVEFDILIDDERGFSGAIWRMTDPDNFEEFYLRHHLSGKPDANQYTPVFNALPAWQLYHGSGYSSPTTYNFNEWMHVRVEFSGSEGVVFVDSETPSLRIQELKHAIQAGSVGVMSNYAPAYFSNFEVTERRPTLTERSDAPNVAPQDGLIDAWEVSAPFSNAEIEDRVNIGPDILEPKTWRVLEAGADGTTNLAMLAGTTGDRDTVFAKARVRSPSAQTVKLQFGYSDKVRVFVNGALIYQGTNEYRSRDYRYLGTIGLFDAIFVDFEPGINELVFAVQESFGGWGIAARVASALDKDSNLLAIETVAAGADNTGLKRAIDQMLLEKAAVDGFSGSVLVSRDDEILLRRTYGPSTGSAPDSEPAYWIASTTKQITGALIAVLASDGMLDLDARITRYLSDIPNDKREITLRQLLTNTSGIGQNYAAEGVADRNVALRRIVQPPLVAQPGTKYSYSNDGFTLLAIIAEIVSSESYEDLVKQHVLEPLKMSDTGFWGYEDPTQLASVPNSPALRKQVETIYSNGIGVENWGYRGATGIYSTTSDLHSWLTAIVNSIGLTDEPLASIARPEFFVRDVEGVGSVYYGFGLAVVLRDGELNMVSHIGDDDWLGHNSAVSAYADGDIIVVLSNAGYLDDGTPWSARITSDIRRLLGR